MGAHSSVRKTDPGTPGTPQSRRWLSTLPGTQHQVPEFQRVRLLSGATDALACCHTWMYIVTLTVMNDALPPHGIRALVQLARRPRRDVGVSPGDPNKLTAGQT
jgi:hypothetical protein